MKKVFLIFSCLLILALSVVGCGKREMNDQAYLEDLAKGLMARWDISASGQEESKEYMNSCVDAELNALSPVEDYIFTDERLETLANEYMEALNKQKEGITYYGSDDSTFMKLYKTEGLNARTKVLSQIDDLYGINVADSYKTYKDDMVMIGKKVIAIESLLEQPLELENKGNMYEMVLENTTSYDLSSLQFNYQFLDGDGIVIDNPVTYLDKWAPGAKQKLEPYASSSGEEIDSVKMQIQANEDGIMTEFVPVEYVNNMVVNLEADGLPKEVSYGYNGEPYVSCIINDIAYEINGWYDGKTQLLLTFSGTKTYDKDGDSVSNSLMFTYQIIDDNGATVDSGTAYADAMRTGDTFNNMTTYTSSNIAPGNYKIVIEDYMN